MKTILATTDFSEYAGFAVMSAASIARETGAQLILLHVINSAHAELNSGDDSYENYHNMPGGHAVVGFLMAEKQLFMEYP